MNHIDIIGVRVIPTDEIRYYNANGLSLKLNDYCVVPTSAGDRLAIVIVEKTIEEKKIFSLTKNKPLKNVIRKANTKDMLNNKNNIEDAKEALTTCRNKVKERELNMKVLDAWYNLNRSRLTFYFSAEGRIDFRELVKDLAHIFKTRIELFQVGVRDNAKKIGGLGMCGKELCCKSWLPDFAPITIRMAKIQCLNLAPHKFSGVCSRLLCCLDYENKFYEEEIKKFPQRNTKVEYQQNEGIVISFNIFKSSVTLKLNNGSTVEITLEEFNKLKIIEQGKEDLPEFESEELVIE